jgi:hypothetical protein
MIRVKAMKSTNNLLVIIVLSSVERVMVMSQSSRTLDDQFQILSSMNLIRESAQMYPDESKVFMKRGLGNRDPWKPTIPYLDYDYDYDYDSYSPPSTVER